MIYRQGDLLIRRVKTIPNEAVKADAVLARGEVTGHSHRAQQMQVYRTSQQTFLKGEGQVVHEEHAPLELPEGTYEVVRQREYNPTENRLIND